MQLQRHRESNSVFWLVTNDPGESITLKCPSLSLEELTNVTRPPAHVPPIVPNTAASMNEGEEEIQPHHPKSISCTRSMIRLRFLVQVKLKSSLSDSRKRYTSHLWLSTSCRPMSACANRKRFLQMSELGWVQLKWSKGLDCVNTNPIRSSRINECWGVCKPGICQHLTISERESHRIRREDGPFRNFQWEWTRTTRCRPLEW